jgi:hypothetical protein
LAAVTQAWNVAKHASAVARFAWKVHCAVSSAADVAEVVVVSPAHAARKNAPDRPRDSCTSERGEDNTWRFIWELLVWLSE